MELAEALFRRAEEALKSAKILLEHGKFEDSISRAFYAMFNAARALLYSKGLEVRTHKGAISLFGEHFVKKGILSSEYADIFRKAFDLRQKSDYDPYTQFSQEIAEETISNAERFINKIKDILKQKVSKLPFYSEQVSGAVTTVTCSMYSKVGEFFLL
jgi:hypothetical protein